MNSKSITYIIDKRSKYYFDNLGLDCVDLDQDSTISYVNNVRVLITFCRVCLINFNLIYSKKLFNLVELYAAYSRLKSIRSNQFLLVYTSLNPYLHFALSLIGAERVVMLLPFILLERHKKIKFLHPNSHALVQGEFDKKFVLKHWQVKSTVVGGFFLSTLYSEAENKNLFEVGFISQMTEEMLLEKSSSKFWSKHFGDVVENTKLSIKDIIKVGKGPFAILLRHEIETSASKYEIDFYKSLIGTSMITNFNFLYPNNGGSYKNLNKCGLLVSVNSNLALEALSVGKKVIFYQQLKLNSFFSLLNDYTKDITAHNFDQFSFLFKLLAGFESYQNIKILEKPFDNVVKYNKNYLETLKLILNEK